MFPVVMRLRIRPKGKRGISLWIPVILVWIILWALMIVLLPLLVLLAILTWRRGPGTGLLLIYPLIFPFSGTCPACMSKRGALKMRF